jgi:hypothetical protein
MMLRVLLWFLQVYAGGIEFSFEELRAIQYLKGNTPRRFKRGKNINTHSSNDITFCYGKESPICFHFNLYCDNCQVKVDDRFCLS